MAYGLTTSKMGNLIYEIMLGLCNQPDYAIINYSYG